MANGHFSTNGPYRLDERTRFYMEQEAARKEREHVERAARWIAGKLSGHQYDSLSALQRAVVDLITTLQSSPPDDELMATIQRASVALWMGQVDRDSMYRKCVVREENGVRFVA